MFTPDVHTNQLTECKKQLLGGAADVFGGSVSKTDKSEETIQELHAKISQLIPRDRIEMG